MVFESLTDIYRVIYLLHLIIKFLLCWSHSFTWFYIWYKYPLALPGGSVAKNPPVNTGDMGLIPGSGRSPEGGNGNPTPVFLPGESHRQRRLAGHSPWGHKEADTTQGLNININILTSHGHSERSLHSTSPGFLAINFLTVFLPNFWQLAKPLPLPINQCRYMD